MDDKMATEIAQFARKIAKEKTKQIATILLEKLKESAPFGSFISVFGPTFVDRLVENMGGEIYDDIESRVRDFTLTKIAERNGVIVDVEVVEFVDKRSK